MKKVLLALVVLASIFVAAHALAAECPAECTCVPDAHIGEAIAEGYISCPDTGGFKCNAGLDQLGVCMIMGEQEENITNVTNMTVEEGSDSPGNHGWSFNPSSTDFWNEMLQIEITARGNDITINSLTIQASGTGNDKNDISKAELWRDKNNNGIVDNATDKLIDSDIYPADNGAITFNAGYDVDDGDSVTFLISYTMSPSAAVGKTYYLSVTGIVAVERGTVNPVHVLNLPIFSAVKTIQSGCSGNLTLKLLPNPARPNQTVSAVIDNVTDKCANSIAVLKTFACNLPVLLPPVGTCVVQGNGCVVYFNASAKEGLYDYYGCLDINGDGDLSETNEQAKETLTVSNATTTQNETGSTGGVSGSNCGDCTPSAFTACKVPVFALAGKQTGTCTDSCGQTVTKERVCEIEGLETVSPALPAGSPKFVIGNKDYAGPITIAIVVGMIAAVALGFRAGTRKGKRR
jgi:hypothetical protein